ncbi:hypothetical protein HID58_018815, partial [Brassica napus]
IQSFKSKACDCCSEKLYLLNSCILEAISLHGELQLGFSPSFHTSHDSLQDYFYKSADLIFLNDRIYEVNAVRTFMLKCYQLGNPEAIYLWDMYEYFILHLLDEGRETIHLAGERGCLLAKYVDGMLNLAFSVDHRGLDHNYPGFTREYGYDKPEMFMSLLEIIDPNVSYDCWCSVIIEPSPSIDQEYDENVIVVSGIVQLGTSAMKFI